MSKPKRQPLALGQIAEVLDRAAVVLEQRGWAQGVGADPKGRPMAARAHDGRQCLVTALGIACELLALDAKALDDVVVWLRRQLGNGPTLAEWNDTPGREAAEVLTFLRWASAAARAAEALP